MNWFARFVDWFVDKNHINELYQSNIRKWPHDNHCTDGLDELLYEALREFKISTRRKCVILIQKHFRRWKQRHILKKMRHEWYKPGAPGAIAAEKHFRSIA